MKPVDILMISYNRKNFTHMTLESIYMRTRTPYRLIVVDNGSREDQQDMLRDYQKKGIVSVLLLLDRNYGLEYAKNTGLRFVSSTPYFINTDNDLLIQDSHPDWLSQMVDLMNRHPEYGAVSARPQVLYGVPNLFTKDREVGEFWVAGGSYRIMRTDLVKKLGGWRDDWNDSRSEEWQICGKIKNNGYKVGYAKDIRCYHMFGEGNWGYDKGIPHYHEARDFGEPLDVPFDPLTCKPEKEQYELLERFEDRNF